jgi:hypothetical protein
MSVSTTSADRRRKGFYLVGRVAAVIAASIHGFGTLVLSLWLFVSFTVADRSATAPAARVAAAQLNLLEDVYACCRLSFGED